MIILFKKGTGAPTKMNEFGFESLLASGEWFLTREEAIKEVTEEKEEIPDSPPIETVTKPQRKTRKTRKKRAKKIKE